MRGVLAGLNFVIEKRKPDLKRAKSQKKLILEVDPTIKIPDISHLNLDFSKSFDSLNHEAEAIKESADLLHYMPRRAKSPELFHKYYSYPIFGFIFITQILAIYLLTVNYSGYTIPSESFDISSHQGENATIEATGSTLLDNESQFIISASKTFLKFELIRYTIFSFLFALLQNIFVFIFTSKRFFKPKLNKKILEVSSDIKTELQEEETVYNDFVTIQIPEIREWIIETAEKLQKIQLYLSEMEPNNGPMFTSFGL